MFLKFKIFLQKLFSLVLNGEFSKIKHSLRLRLNGFLGKEPSLRSKVESHQEEIIRVLSSYFNCDNHFRPDTINVALIVRGGAIMPQSSAFIRLVAPLTHSSIQSKVSIRIYPENTLMVDEGADICIVQRTAFDSLYYAKRLVSYLKSKGVRLIVDTDDAFMELDPEHIQYKEQVKLIKSMEYLINKSEQLWLSTQQLAESFNHHHKVIMANTLDKRIWQLHDTSGVSKSTTTSPLQILYAGTATHDSDLALVMPALENIYNNHPGAFELTIIGVTDKSMDYPWIKKLQQPEPFGAMYPNFISWLLEQGPFDIGLSPLENSKFNQSKSDIKCLDYLAAGIVPVVSDIKPYQTKDIQDFIIKVKNTESAWTNTLESIINNPQELRHNKAAIIPKAQEYIWSHRSSENSSSKMLAEIKKLLQK